MRKLLLNAPALLANLARGYLIMKRVITLDNGNQKITYQVGNITFIVTPVYQTERSESIVAILLRLMKADAERV